MTTTLSNTHVTDIVPEFIHYEDTGCEVSQACLNCPLPQCKYDDPAWFQRHQRLIKDLEVLTAMRLENLSVEETAERFSVTVRTIFRIMRRCREAGMHAKDKNYPLHKNLDIICCS